MANGFGIQGSSGNLLDVNSSNEAKVALTTAEASAGFVSLASEIDDGTVRGSRYVKALELSEDYRLRVGVDSIVFHHSFEGTDIGPIT